MGKRACPEANDLSLISRTPMMERDNWLPWQRTSTRVSWHAHVWTHIHARIIPTPTASHGWFWYSMLLLTLIPHTVSGFVIFFYFIASSFFFFLSENFMRLGWRENTPSIFINTFFGLKYFWNGYVEWIWCVTSAGGWVETFFLPTNIKVETQHFLCWLTLLSKSFFTLLFYWARGPLGIHSRAPRWRCTALLQRSPVPGPRPRVLLKLNGLIYKTSAKALRVPCLLGWASPALLASTPFWLLRIKIT